MSLTLDMNPALRFHSTYMASFSAIGVSTFLSYLRKLSRTEAKSPEKPASRL
jgi:hypothetical protein